ncbi:MAG: hypothetical protein WA635_05885 [Gallionella sp.]
MNKQELLGGQEMKTTKMFWVIFFSFIVAACGGSDTVNVDAPTYLKSMTVTADAPTPAPTLGKAFYTMQFHAAANYSDGTSRDASGIVTWVSGNGSMITIDKNGLGTFDLTNLTVNDLFGDVTIWASFTTAFDSVILTISPPAPGAPAESFGWDITPNNKN